MENTDPGRPEGEEGLKMLERMNNSHAFLRDFALPRIEWKDGMHILDIGCGGGATIHQMLELSRDSIIDGVDYSDDSMILAKKTNADEIGRRVFLKKGNVLDLPYRAETFDLATAVETTYFWPDMEKAFREVARVLKKTGVFAVICEGSDPDLHKDWPNPNGTITIYRPSEYEAFYAAAGFVNVTLDHGPGDVIMMRGTKI